MTEKQFDGIVDCLVNVCTFNTSRDFSLSLQPYVSPTLFHGEIIVFPNGPKGLWTTGEIAQLLGLAEAWNVSLYFQTMHGVTVARYL